MHEGSVEQEQAAATEQVAIGSAGTANIPAASAQADGHPGDAPTPAIQPRNRRKDADSVENTFSYHRPFGDQEKRYVEIRAHARAMARMLKENCLPSRQLSLALTKLEEATMWANKAIAVNEQAMSEEIDL